MTAYNVVHMRVKPGREADFLAVNQAPGEEVKAGLRKAAIIKTGERSYCFIGEWDSIEALAAARGDMVAHLDTIRDMLEDLGDGSVTQASSGTTVAERSHR